jgi:hypothetical protein
MHTMKTLPRHTYTEAAGGLLRKLILWPLYLAILLIGFIFAVVFDLIEPMRDGVNEIGRECSDEIATAFDRLQYFAAIMLLVGIIIVAVIHAALSIACYLIAPFDIVLVALAGAVRKGLDFAGE